MTWAQAWTGSIFPYYVILCVELYVRDVTCTERMRSFPILRAKIIGFACKTGSWSGKNSTQNAPKPAVLSSNVQKFSAEGSQSPPQTPPPVGRGIPLPHAPLPSAPLAPRSSRLRRSITPKLLGASFVDPLALFSQLTHNGNEVAVGSHGVDCGRQCDLLRSPVVACGCSVVLLRSTAVLLGVDWGRLRSLAVDCGFQIYPFTCSKSNHVRRSYCRETMSAFSRPWHWRLTLTLT